MWMISPTGAAMSPFGTKSNSNHFSMVDIPLCGPTASQAICTAPFQTQLSMLLHKELQKLPDPCLHPLKEVENRACPGVTYLPPTARHCSPFKPCCDGPSLDQKQAQDSLLKFIPQLLRSFNNSLSMLLFSGDTKGAFDSSASKPLGSVRPVSATCRHC